LRRRRTTHAAAKIAASTSTSDRVTCARLAAPGTAAVWPACGAAYDDGCSAAVAMAGSRSAAAAWKTPRFTSVS
jgi:hypothetical protein